jgi:hypothetical protein
LYRTWEFRFERIFIMDNKRIRYIYHLDNIRVKKNLTVVQVCDGICSDRQYRKYLTGENNISDQRIMEFCDNLGISSRDFYYSLNEKDVFELNKIKKVYYAIGNKQYKTAEDLLFKIRNSFMTNQNERFFYYCEIRLKYESKQLNKNDTLLAASKYVNYPECESYNVFDFVDILYILLISQIEIDTDIIRGIKILIKILTNNDFIYLSSENRNIIPPIFSTVTIMLGKLKMFERCIEIADKGIEFCTKYDYYKSLTRLYYSKAIAYQMIKDDKNAEFNAVLCLTNVISLNNRSDIKYFYNLLKKDFKIDPFSLIQEYKDDILK